MEHPTGSALDNAMNISHHICPNCHMGAHVAVQFAAKGYPVMEMTAL